MGNKLHLMHGVGWGNGVGGGLAVSPEGYLGRL